MEEEIRIIQGENTIITEASSSYVIYDTGSSTISSIRDENGYYNSIDNGISVDADLIGQVEPGSMQISDEEGVMIDGFNISKTFTNLTDRIVALEKLLDKYVRAEKIKKEGVELWPQ